MMVKIGLIGTGMLGEAVGLHLLKSGYSLTAYNRTKSKTSNLEKNGAVVSDTPKRVAESSELVIICVKDSDAVDEVIQKCSSLGLANVEFRHVWFTIILWY